MWPKLHCTYPDWIHVHIIPPDLLEIRLSKVGIQFWIVHFVVYNAVILFVQAW